MPVHVRDLSPQNFLIDVSWPDGRRTRYYRAPGEASGLAAQIDAALRCGIESAWAELRQSLRRGKKGAADCRIRTLAALFDVYSELYVSLHNKSVGQKANRISVIRRHLGECSLFELSPARVERLFIVPRQAAGASAATINRDLSVLKHALRWAVSRDYLESDPLSRLGLLPEPKWEGQKPTSEVIRRVFRKLPEDVAPIFVFIRETGCRLGEALSLEHWQLDGESVLFEARSTKGKKSRRIPLSAEARDAVSALPAVCKTVFYNPRTMRTHSKYWVRYAWENARRAADCEWLRVQDLRRALAIRAAERGAPMHFIQSWLGHSSVALTESHYAQFSPADANRAVLKVLKGGRR